MTIRSTRNEGITTTVRQRNGEGIELVFGSPDGIVPDALLELTEKTIPVAYVGSKIPSNRHTDENTIP